MEDYEKLLDMAYLKVKKVAGSGERFEMPKVEGRFQGKKTIITNFLTIASRLRRSPDHFQKFLLKELAAAGVLEGDWLVLNKKVTSAKINPKIEQYSKEFVICKECQKPDTELVREDRLTYLHCLACGAKHTIYSKV